VQALIALPRLPKSIRELVPALSVAFIAVDSPASIAGGGGTGRCRRSPRVSPATLASTR
jgi:hypothetical protein